MGIFSHAPKVSTDEKAIDELLLRGVAEVIGKDELKRKLLGGTQLRIKLGIDPTSPDLHIGRAVSLLKLRDFQELGHHIVLIVGDFTAVIGDTSDKDAERPMLEREVIEKNKKTYFDQVGKLLDLSRTELRYNSEWLEPLTYREIGEHADAFSVADFIARDVIRRRLDAGKRVSLREVLYPLMQGYDSVAVKADVEIGGMDQKFNLLAGRTLQEKYKQPPQNIVMSPLIDGLDGTKMSSSKGNVITLNAKAADMYGKVMSMADEQLAAYFELCTRTPMHEVKDILAGHPKEAKMRLAKEIVTLYHSKQAAEKAQENFEKVFSKKEIPEEVTEIKTAGLLRETLIHNGIISSNSEFSRLALANAIRRMESSGEIKITNALAPAPIGTVFRIGKHRFVKIIKN
ncbi:MAG: tyrosyl-tRNA synthetase [Parcubacteria group bacterium Gr01-1014_56]|nr:MAG: tyrosyl-tRNA synthetase [Parcubacteria group bacterium Gr01-1014_56]